jgi:DNA polymerase-3 subunit alpha
MRWRKARPDRLEDLIALNALYRPGPMDFIPDFIARKHGRERVVYPHPCLEKVLATTYGIMVYQEQVMQTAQVAAGYSLGGADLLRRAMGKKKPEEMAKQREIFVTGAAANGIGEAQANEIFDTMEKFAGYGFNKSHAAAYSLVAYHTAWLKCHHPAAFTRRRCPRKWPTPTRSSSSTRTRSTTAWLFLPPDINHGGIRFRPVDGKTIRYGLGAIKGTGEAALSVILKARETGGPFTRPVRFLPPHRQARGEPAGDRGADPRRRLRRHRRSSRQAAGLDRRGAGSGRAGRAQRPAGRPVRHGRRRAGRYRALCRVPRWSERER